MQTDAGAHRVFVWDWPTRVFHWIVVLGVAGSFATHYAGIEWFPWHRRLGYATLVLLSFRLAWGFVGQLFANDEIANAGPFFGWVAQETSNRLTHWHEVNSKVLIALIVLHVAAVGWYDLRHRAGLTTAMLTGYKLLPAAGAGIDSSRATVSQHRQRCQPRWTA